MTARLAGVMAVLLGGTIGILSGWLGGMVDAVLMRTVDALMAIPRLFIVLVVLALWERVTVPAMIVILGGTGWFGISRLVRAEVRAARTRGWVAAARAAGVPDARIVLRHVLPNIAGPVIVAATMQGCWRSRNHPFRQAKVHNRRLHSSTVGHSPTARPNGQVWRREPESV